MRRTQGVEQTGVRSRRRAARVLGGSLPGHHARVDPLGSPGLEQKHDRVVCGIADIGGLQQVAATSDAARAWLDIYKPVFRGERLYVKFTPLEAGSATSFCPSLVTVRSTETEVVGVSRREYPAECGICGARAVRLSSAPLQREFREGTFAVEGFEYERCDACGEGFIDAAQIDPIQRAGVEAARAGLGRLSSSDIREMRLAIGITQTVLESQLGVSAGTVGRWERGGELQTRIADNFMRLLFAHPELVTEAMGAMARDSRGPYRPRAR